MELIGYTIEIFLGDTQPDAAIVTLGGVWETPTVPDTLSQAIRTHPRHPLFARTIPVYSPR